LTPSLRAPIFNPMIDDEPEAWGEGVEPPPDDVVAETDPSAAAVATSTDDVTDNPFALWNACNAVRVAGPNTPSAPPGTEMPAPISYC
jgi:hypothetical protein